MENISESRIFDIYIQDIYGKKYNIMCIGYQNTIEYIKNMLCYKYLKIDPHKVSLFYKNEKLLDGLSLADYGIRDGATLQLHIIMKTGFKIR